jgi:hypothetical protein
MRWKLNESSTNRSEKKKSPKNRHESNGLYMQQHHQSSRSSGSNKEQEEEEEAIQPPPQRRQCKYNLDDPGDSQVGSIPENLGDKENFLSFAFFACFARRAQEENAFFGRLGKSGMRRGQQRRSGVGQKSRAEQKRGRKGRDPPSRVICILAINALKKPRTTTFPVSFNHNTPSIPPENPSRPPTQSFHPSIRLSKLHRPTNPPIEFMAELELLVPAITQIQR